MGEGVGIEVWVGVGVGRGEWGKYCNRWRRAGRGAYKGLSDCIPYVN